MPLSLWTVCHRLHFENFSNFAGLSWSKRECDVAISFRRKREDDCLDCIHSQAASDVVYLDYRRRHQCLGKNLMVCKNCKAANLQGVSLHTYDGGFEVWCFDMGWVADPHVMPVPIQSGLENQFRHLYATLEGTASLHCPTSPMHSFLNICSVLQFGHRGPSVQEFEKPGGARLSNATALILRCMREIEAAVHISSSECWALDCLALQPLASCLLDYLNNDCFWTSASLSFCEYF